MPPIAGFDGDQVETERNVQERMSAHEQKGQLFHFFGLFES